jgi:hypothetical protein
VAQVNGYLTAEETATQWGISVRQVQILCQSGKIEGAMKFCKVWAIPDDAVKPTRTGKSKPGRKPRSERE